MDWYLGAYSQRINRKAICVRVEVCGRLSALWLGETDLTHDAMTRCEQKKEYRTVDGGSEGRWSEVSVSSIAAETPRDRLRCLHCHGAVRVHLQQVSHGPQDHVEHLSRKDSEHCRAGYYYTGGEHRMSSHPVE